MCQVGEQVDVWPGAANNVTATPSTAAEHGWPSGFAVQQMMSGEVVVDQEGAWLDELHRHSSLLDYVPKFPKEEVDHCKFLADRPWADQACHLEQQTDQRVELSTDSGDGIHFHMYVRFSLLLPSEICDLHIHFLLLYPS